MNKKNNLPPKWAVKKNNDPRFEKVIALMKIIDIDNEGCWTGKHWDYYGYDGNIARGGTNAWDHKIPDHIPELTLDEFIEATETKWVPIKGETIFVSNDQTKYILKEFVRMHNNSFCCADINGVESMWTYAKSLPFEKQEEPIERKMWSENKAVLEKMYTIKQEILEDGRARMTRTNDGFNAYELVGILQLTINDIQKQMFGEIKPPDIIKRRLIQDVPSDSEFCISKEDLQNIVSASEKLNELLHKCKI